MTQRSVLFAVCALALIAVPATGNSEFVSSQPAAGACLRVQPTVVRLSFTEPLGRVLQLRVRDERGRDRSRAVRRDPRSSRRAQTALLPGTRGRLRVQWVVVAADGFTQGGGFSFRVARGCAR